MPPRSLLSRCLLDGEAYEEINVAGGWSGLGQHPKLDWSTREAKHATVEELRVGLLIGFQEILSTVAPGFVPASRVASRSPTRSCMRSAFPCRFEDPSVMLDLATSASDPA